MPESKLTPVSWTELVKRLRKLGFDPLSRILKRAGITREEWLKK